MHYSLTDTQADFEINRAIRCQITAKINYFYRRQTDGPTKLTLSEKYSPCVFDTDLHLHLIPYNLLLDSWLEF